MATPSPAHSPLTRRDPAAERDDPETQNFLTIPQLGFMLTLGTSLWAAVLGPFLF